jgi:hypothetical protein
MIIMKMAKPAKMRIGRSLATLAPVCELDVRILEVPVDQSVQPLRTPQSSA